MGRWIDGEGHYQRLRWKFRLPTTPCGAAVPLRLRGAIDRERIELQTRLSRVHTSHTRTNTRNPSLAPESSRGHRTMVRAHFTCTVTPDPPRHFFPDNGGYRWLLCAWSGGNNHYLCTGWGWGNRPPAWSSARRARWFLLGRTVLSGEAHTTEGIPQRHLGIRDRDRRVGPISSDKGKRARLCWWERWAAWRWVGLEWETRPTRRFVFSFSIFWFFSFLFQIQTKPQV
jgi:hypothetical protein